MEIWGSAATGAGVTSLCALVAMSWYVARPNRIVWSDARVFRAMLRCPGVPRLAISCSRCGGRMQKMLERWYEWDCMGPPLSAWADIQYMYTRTSRDPVLASTIPLHILQSLLEIPNE